MSLKEHAQSAKCSSVTDHENGFLASVSETQLHRIQELLNNPKQRKKLTAMLAHSIETAKPGWQQIPPNRQSADQILQALQELSDGQTACYCISENKAIDGQFLQLDVVIKAIVGFGLGTILSIIPGTLIYYEGEGKNQRLIWSTRHLYSD